MIRGGPPNERPKPKPRMGGSKMALALGASAQDKITGFSGKITGVCRYIAGANQYLLAPPVDAEGKYVKAVWFDEDRVVEIEEKD